MVANTPSLAERFMPPPELLPRHEWRMVRFTRHDVEALLRAGVIPEDASTELLGGVIVAKDRAAQGEDPLTVGNAHRKCVERLSNLRARINSDRRHVETQQPLICSDHHVPEPDFVVLRGTLEASDEPAAADAWCVVEVADLSYERDADLKLREYARAGVAQYIILNLRNRTAEVYTGPDRAAGSYPPPVVIPSNGTLPLRVGDDESLDVPLAEVLP